MDLIERLRSEADISARPGQMDRLNALADEFAAALAAAQQRIACLPADWREDSSLETWFPITAEEIERLRAENARLREDAARYRWLRDREIPEWLDLWHQNPDRIDAAIDQARGRCEP